jgi:hypothetical protein
VVVQNRKGIGVPGVTVNATDASPVYSPTAQLTDQNGCVLFRSVPTGTYTIVASLAGYVDVDGNPTETVSQKVVPGSTSFKSINYDQAVSPVVTVATLPPGSASTTLQTSHATTISATNAMRTGQMRQWTSTTPASSFSASGLYPFNTSPYSFFTGACLYEIPTTYSSTGDAVYYSTYAAALLLADPTVTKPVTVVQPPFNLRIASAAAGSTTVPTNTNETIYATLQKPSSASSDTCAEPTVQMALMDWPGGTWGNNPGGGTSGWVSQSTGTFDPGMPFGKYTVCVRDTSGTQKKYWTGTIDDTPVAGSANTTVTSSMFTSSKC